MRVTAAEITEQFNKDVESLRRCIEPQGKPPISITVAKGFYHAVQGFFSLHPELTDQHKAGLLFSLAATEAEAWNSEHDRDN